MKKPFDRILIVMFENQYRGYVMQDPFMQKLASAGANMANYFGAFHPSQTNYIASLAAEVCAVSNDTPPAKTLLQQTLVDLLEAGGVSWKAYMEGYPGEPWNPEWKSPSYTSTQHPLAEFPPKGSKDLSRYYRKHNAFASFHTIQADPERWKKIVSEVQFWNDVANGLPDYSWFTPDIWNDGHYLYNTHIDTDPRTQLVPQLSSWLQHVFLGDIAATDMQGGAATGQENLGLAIDVDLLLTDPAKAWAQSRVPAGTLIVVTFDEADYDATGYDTNYDGPNQVYTVLLGDMIEPGTVIETPYNHYSLIRTVEKNYALADLGKNDRDANWFRFLWAEKFAWNGPQDASINAGADLALSYLNGQAYLVFKETGGNSLKITTLTEASWSPPVACGFGAQGVIALAGLGDALHLVFEQDSGQLSHSTFTPHDGWSAPQALNQSIAGTIALTAYLDHGDQQEKLMLCWQTDMGFIQSLIYQNSAWRDPSVEVNQLTDGPMTLAQLGPSLYLVYKERNTRKMRMTSYNTGLFNAFSALTFAGKPAPENDTTIYHWAPADFPVGHFAKKFAALQNNYQALGNLVLATIPGEMHLVHRGAYTDTPNVYTEFFGLTGIFTAAKQLSNGFGTIDQAGWTRECELTEVRIEPEGGIAMASNGDQLLLVWQHAGGTELMFATAGYVKR